MPNPIRKPILAVAAVVAVAASACGGGSEGSGLATLVDSPTTIEAADPEGADLEAEPTVATAPAGEEASGSVDAGTAGNEASGPVDGTAGGAGASGSGSGGAAEAEGEGSEDMTDEERLFDFAECMRENGVDFPDPVVEADGTVTFGLRPGQAAQDMAEIGRDPDLPAARDACRGLLEGLAFGPGSGDFDQTELQDAQLEFAQCMRDNGVDMGDPDLRSFGPGGNDDEQPGGPFGGIDLDDPDVSAAFEVCQQQTPLTGRGPGLGGRR